MDANKLEDKINNNTEKLEILTEQLSNDWEKVKDNSDKIEKNSGALSLLHTIKAGSDKYFAMWLITFVTMLVLVGYIIFAGR